MTCKDCNRKCDNCKHYQWYYDLCSKCDCKVDDRSVCADYEPKEERSNTHHDETCHCPRCGVSVNPMGIFYEVEV